MAINEISLPIIMRAADIHTEAIGQLITGTALVSVLMKYIGKVMSACSQSVNLHRWERRVSMSWSHPIWWTDSFSGGGQMKHRDGWSTSARPIWCHQKHLLQDLLHWSSGQLEYSIWNGTKWRIKIWMGVVMIRIIRLLSNCAGDAVSQWKTENVRNASGVLMMVRCREMEESKSVAAGWIPF